MGKSLEGWRRLFQRVANWFVEAAVFFGLLFGVAVFLETLAANIIPLAGVLMRVFGRWGSQILIALAVVGAGALAHWFKRKNQEAYGYVEVLFGSAAAINIVFSRPTAKELLFSQWASLVACTYVVARGLNNRFEGKEKKHEDSVQSVISSKVG
jgi:hypothetical protein